MLLCIFHEKIFLDTFINTKYIHTINETESLRQQFDTASSTKIKNKLKYFSRSVFIGIVLE